MNAKKFVNLTKFLLAGALVLGMTACSSDDNIPKGGTETGAKGYMTVSISNDAIQRTINDNHSDEGTTAESKINSLAIILVDKANSTISKIIQDATLVATTNSGSVENVGQTTKPFQVPAGTYKVYVIANPVADLIGEGKPINVGTAETVLKSYSGTLSGYATSNNFMMTNAIDYNNDESSIPSIAVTAANTESNPAVASTIHLDRLAVKINIKSANTGTNVFSFTPSSTITIHTGATTTTVSNIQINSWTLLNDIKTAYAFQGWKSATKTLTNDLIATNFFAAFDTTAAYNNTMSSFSIRTKGGDFVSGYTVLKDSKSTNFTDLTAGSNVKYCLETNPMPVKQFTSSPYTVTKYENEAPGVLFKATATINGNSGTSFFSYAGNYYLTLGDIKNAYPNAFAVGSFDEATTLVDNSKPEYNPSTLRTKYGIRYYEGGVMYFTKYLRDQNYSTTYANNTKTGYTVTPLTAAENYYALMRNSVYNLNINSVNGIGTDIPFGWNPNETPVDGINDNNTYLRIDVVVNKWASNSYNINF